jgi:hypothetical protein
MHLTTKVKERKLSRIREQNQNFFPFNLKEIERKHHSTCEQLKSKYETVTITRKKLQSVMVGYKKEQHLRPYAEVFKAPVQDADIFYNSECTLLAD